MRRSAKRMVQGSSPAEKDAAVIVPVDQHRVQQNESWSSETMTLKARHPKRREYGSASVGSTPEELARLLSDLISNGRNPRIIFHDPLGCYEPCQPQKPEHRPKTRADAIEDVVHDLAAMLERARR